VSRASPSGLTGVDEGHHRFAPPAVRSGQGEQTDSVVEAVQKRSDVPELGSKAEAHPGNDIDPSACMERVAAIRRSGSDERVRLHGDLRRLGEGRNRREDEQAEHADGFAEQAVAPHPVRCRTPPTGLSCLVPSASAPLPECTEVMGECENGTRHSAARER